MTRSDCLAVIPARGGSQRIPGKNIRPLLGRPLIAYTVEAALDSGLFARVVVSTDSAEIAELACGLGAEAPFLRAARLADDRTPVSLATVDALERLDPAGSSFTHVAQLMANCPLRTAADIVDSHARITSSGSPAQISVSRFGWLNPWWAMRKDQEGTLELLFQDAAESRSQDLPDLFCPNGAVWWARSAILRSQRTFHVDGRTGWELPWERAVDIDDEDDWRLAEILMRARSAGSAG